jgi:transposase
MPRNFIECDRDQELLLPPSMREWLPEDHLAWFVADAVEEMDLAAFYGAYREDGWGRAAFEPQMMVALLLYAYAVGERSSRGIERRCREDVALRVLAANQIPDHATTARFRARHEQALADTFTEVLALCAKAGLVSVGVVALDGTLLAANASLAATRAYPEIRAEVERMLEEAADLTQSPVDSTELAPMVAKAGEELRAVGVEESIGTLLADGGYWSAPQIAAIREQGTEVIVPTRNARRTAPRKLAAKQGPEAKRIEQVLATPEGRALYKRRQQIVEPVFANTKFIRGATRFQRRGLAACRAEWKLLAATHNLLKLWRAGLARLLPA